MGSPTSIVMTGKHRAVLIALLGVAIFAPALLVNSTAFGVPLWVGSAIGLAALFTALVVMWRAGELRGGFVFLFLATIAAAFAIGWFMGGRP